MKDYIAFEINEIETLLTIAKGEVMRYENMAKKQPDKQVVCEIYKAKWKGKTDTFEELLKFGKKIKLEENELEN